LGRKLLLDHHYPAAVVLLLRQFLGRRQQLLLWEQLRLRQRLWLWKRLRLRERLRRRLLLISYMKEGGAEAPPYFFR